MAFPDDLEEEGTGDTVPQEPPEIPPTQHLLCWKDRSDATRNLIISSGDGITILGENSGHPYYALSEKDGDEVTLLGGDTGAAFQYFFLVLAAQNKLKVTNEYISKKGFALGQWLAMREVANLACEGSSEDAWKQANKKVKARRKDLKDKDVDIIQEDHILALPPGSAFTFKNAEDLFADEYLTEFEGFIQWVFLASPVAVNITEDQAKGYWQPEEFGTDIERKTDVRPSHTFIRKYLRPFTPPPEDLDITVTETEDGQYTTGADIETGDSLAEDLWDKIKDGLGGLWEKIQPYVYLIGLALVAILAIWLMITFRAPIGALLKVTTDSMTEGLQRL
jgi:hypothetical protein